MVVALLALPACKKQPPAPSPEYDQAWRLYANLYARQLDDAFGNAQMEDVVALLKRVDDKSADADAARTLLQRIDEGRKALAAERDARAKVRKELAPDAPGRDLIAAVNAAAGPPSADAGAPATTATSGVDAGPAPQDPFAPGSSIAALNSSTGGCLVAGEPFKERISNRTGQVYRVAPSELCQQKLTGLSGQAVLVVDGRIYRRVSASEVAQPAQPLAAPNAQAAAGSGSGAAPAAQAAAPTPAAPPGTAMNLSGAPPPPPKDDFGPIEATQPQPDNK
jgi:hypothetical protein